MIQRIRRIFTAILITLCCLLALIAIIEAVQAGIRNQTVEIETFTYSPLDTRHLR